MQVVINGATTMLESATSIAVLLTQLKIDVARGVAVALNHNVVPKSGYASTFLKEGDQLEIIHATAGG